MLTAPAKPPQGVVACRLVNACFPSCNTGCKSCERWRRTGYVFTLAGPCCFCFLFVFVCFCASGWLLTPVPVTWNVDAVCCVLALVCRVVWCDVM